MDIVEGFPSWQPDKGRIGVVVRFGTLYRLIHLAMSRVKQLKGLLVVGRCF